MLPVLIQWSAYHDVEGGFGGGGLDLRCSADVFPMTERHVDTVLPHIRAGGKRSSKRKPFVDLKGTDAEWIDKYSTESIPFYSPELSGTSIAWREDVQDAIEHTGNESRPHEEDSIYLSYAVGVLPKRGTKRKRT
ncbi:hypothetical protein DFH09DRAFT_1102888 [Mycena vulgaris]|nr:hypothetical protein DFH09DRAFT_1102888 [Mycena vulgaris]